MNAALIYIYIIRSNIYFLSPRIIMELFLMLLYIPLLCITIKYVGLNVEHELRMQTQ